MKIRIIFKIGDKYSLGYLTLWDRFRLFIWNVCLTTRMRYALVGTRFEKWVDGV